jgi:hypothetical protein
MNAFFIEHFEFEMARKFNLDEVLDELDLMHDSHSGMSMRIKLRWTFPVVVTVTMTYMMYMGLEWAPLLVLCSVTIMIQKMSMHLMMTYLVLAS